MKEDEEEEDDSEDGDRLGKNVAIVRVPWAFFVNGGVSDGSIGSVRSRRAV